MEFFYLLQLFHNTLDQPLRARFPRIDPCHIMVAITSKAVTEEVSCQIEKPFFLVTRISEISQIMLNKETDG